MPTQLTLKQLRYFIALAETRQFRKAAERVGVSQPSLSQQIVGLEAALGLDLVERGHRGAVLTTGGREVLIQARKVIEETLILKAIAQDANEGVSGTIRLGASPTLGPYFLPFVMRRLHETYPSLKIIIREAAPLILQDDLLNGQHDLILTQLPVRSADVEVARLFREPLKLVAARDHPFAAQEGVEDADLKGQDVLALSSAYRLHNQIVALCEDLGANLRQEYEGNSLDALRQMTALKMGVSFLPAIYVLSEVASETGDVVIRSFRNDSFTRSIGLVWRKRSAQEKVISRIVAVIREVADDRFSCLVTLE